MAEETQKTVEDLTGEPRSEPDDAALDPSDVARRRGQPGEPEIETEGEVHRRGSVSRQSFITDSDPSRLPSFTRMISKQ